MEIPSEQDWQYDPECLDEAWAYKNFHGKSFDEAVRLFEVNALCYQEDLMYMPGRVFDFYVRTFIAYLMSDAARHDSDGASCFISLIQFKAEHDPETIRPPWPAIEPALKHLVEHQDDYDAAWHIYGNFRVKVHEIVQRGFPVSFPTDVCEIVPRDVTINLLSRFSAHRASFPVAVQVFRNSGLAQIDFDSKKSEILRILGPPDDQGGGVHPEYGPIPCWCRYDRPDHSLYFMFIGDLVSDVMFMPPRKSDGPVSIVARVARAFGLDGRPAPSKTNDAEPSSSLDAAIRFERLFHPD
jgi:hypothetical protein